MKKILCILLLQAMLAAITGCSSIEDDRIPPAPVSLTFRTVADWDMYANPAALEYKMFIKEQRIPSNFNYTAISETGLGGILIVGDVMGMFLAYDLACPVEIKKDIRLKIDSEKHDAYCPTCGSRYDIFANYGSPTSGPAAEKGYGLQKYYVGAGNSGEYMVVRRR